MSQSKGTLIYDPDLNNLQYRPWWCILQCSQDLTQYLVEDVYKRYNVRLRPSRWGTHISVVRGIADAPPNPDAWGQYAGHEIEFEYEPQIRNSGKFWFIKCRSAVLSQYRVELGLKPVPVKGFHITLGVDRKWVDPNL